MKFGLFYVLECPDHDYRRAYSEMLDQIEYAEALGFDKVWLAEHHGSDYGSMPSPQIAAAAIAERTTTMRIGVAVSNLTFAYPVRIAEDYAMVDVISGGRLDFGVGRGYQPREFHAMGVEDKMPHSREIFAEALDIIQGLWTHDTFSYRGKHFQLDEVDCRPKPIQTPPPIYVAAISPQTFDLVAEQGHNMLITPTLMTLPELIDFAVDAKRKLIARGRDPLTLNFPMNWQIHLAATEEQALAETEGAFLWYFDEVMKHLPQGANVPPTYERYAELAAAAEEAGGLEVQGLREGGIMLLGTAEQAIDELHRLHDEMGLEEVSCWMRIGGLDDKAVRSSIRIMAEEVIPELKDDGPIVPRALREGVVTSL